MGASDEQIKEWTRKGLNLALPHNGSMSSELMRRCANQQTQTFTEKDVEAISPEYQKELKNIISELNEPFVIGKRTAVDLNKARSVNVDHVDGLEGIHAVPQEQKKIRNDIARALGKVWVTKNEDGSYTLQDHFDFTHKQLKNPDGQYIDQPRELLQFALSSQHITTAPNGDKNTPQSLRNVAIGRMFCKEADSGAPTQSSVPISIRIPPPDNEKGPAR